MKTKTFGFCSATVGQMKQVATFCSSIMIDREGRVTLGQRHNGVGCQERVLCSFDQNPPHTTPSGGAHEIFPLSTNGGKILLARPNKTSDGFLVLIRTKAGSFQNANGGICTIRGPVRSIAQGFGREGHVRFEESLIQIGYGAEVLVIGTDGSRHILVHTGSDVIMMAEAKYREGKMAPPAPKQVANELVRELVAA